MCKPYFKADPNDVIIVIIGPTGSGKTTFINALTGAGGKAKQCTLKPDTKSVIPYAVSHDELRLVFVDTPGFDDACQPDTAILRKAADWLANKYPDGTTLRPAGILYLHKITDNRLSGSVDKNLQVFGRLCGGVPLGRARLVTTMWDSVKDREVAHRRETELTTEFWRQRALPRRFDNTPTSAWDIVDDVLRVGNAGAIAPVDGPSAGGGGAYPGRTNEASSVGVDEAGVDPR